MMLDQEQRDHAEAFNRSVGWRIRERREALGMTRSELAGEAGVDEELLSRIEDGSAEISSWMLASLVPSLRVTPSYLLGLCSSPCGVSTYIWA